MVTKRTNKTEKIVSIESVPYDKIKVRPVSITKDFVTIGCFKYVTVKKIVKNGKKVYEDEITDHNRLVLMWDGNKMSWSLGEVGNELENNGNTYIIDRNIGVGVPLPDESLVERLMDRKKCKVLMRDFEAKDLFDEIYSYFERYFFLEKDYLYSLVTLFVANMWVFDAHDSTPYLFIRSPMRGCGKTYIGTSIANMSNGEMIATPNAVHIFRMSHDTKTPMVMDEIKKLTSEPDKLTQDDKDVLSLINTGFQKYGCKVPRAAETTIGGNKAYKIEMYESYTPKVLITTDGVLPHDTMSRCIDLRMQMASPKGANYDERWNEPERMERIHKIRDLGVLFRLKYGSEIYNISKDINHRKELDAEGIFDGIHGRNLEIFRPLIILTLKYMPEWKGQLERYIRKYIDNKMNTEPSTTHLILMAMKNIYDSINNTAFKSIDSEEFGTISIINDQIYGDIIHYPIKMIGARVKEITIATSLSDKGIIQKLDELGFVAGGINKKGTRTIKIGQLSDMCERYLGTGLGGNSDMSLPQSERQAIVRAALLIKEDGMTISELIEVIDNKLTEEQIKSIVKYYRERGQAVRDGKKYKWIGA